MRAMNMIRKGQMQGMNKRNSLNQAKFIAELFGVAISPPERNEAFMAILFPGIFCNTARSRVLRTGLIRTVGVNGASNCSTWRPCLQRQRLPLSYSACPVFNQVVDICIERARLRISGRDDMSMFAAVAAITHAAIPDGLK